MIVHEVSGDLKVLGVLVGDALDAFGSECIDPGVQVGQKERRMGGEFGRSPVAENGKGRDHHPKGFTMWMAGAGVKGGQMYGSTDEFGYAAVENRVSVPDLHATMLHLLGFDHEQLTYRFQGRDFRLTDVHGEVVKGILA